MALNNMGLGLIFTAKDLASGVMQNVNSNFREVEGTASKAGRAIQSSFKQFGTGLAIMGAGLAGFALLDPAIEESTKLSKAIALIGTEVDKAQFNQDSMREIAEKLATTYGKMPVEQAQAMYKAVALGANDAAKAQDFLNGVNLLAVAGDADLITTTNALGGVLNSYGESFDKATSYGESFFTAMRMGNTTIQDLAASVGRVAPTAKNLNIPFDELIGGISVMTNKGIQANEAVSGLKEALANIVHPSSDARAEAAKLGIKFSQEALRAKGSFASFIGDIVKSPKFTASSFSKLFTSVEGGAAVANIASNSMKDYGAVLAAMKDKAGATQKGFEIMNQTLDFQKKKFEASKAVALGMIGKALEPAAAATLGFFNALLAGFAKLPKPVVTALAKFGVFISTLLTVVGAAIAIKAAISMVIAGLSAAGITVGGLVAAMLPAILVIGALVLAFYGLRMAYDRNLGGFADFVDNIVNSVILSFKALEQLFTQGGFSGAVRAELNAAGNEGIKAFAITVYLWFGRVKAFVSGAMDGFSEAINGIKPSIEAMIVSFQKLGEALGFIGEQDSATVALGKWSKFRAMGEAVGQALATVVEYIVKFETMAATVIRGFVRSWGLVTPAIQNVRNAFGQLGDVFTRVGVQLGLVSPKTKADTWYAVGRVIADVVAIIVNVVAVLVAVISVAVSIISGAIGLVESVFSGLADIVTGVVFVIGGIFTGSWSDIWTGFKLIAFGAIDMLVGVLMELLGVIGSVVDAIAGIFKKDTGFQKGAQDFKNFVHNEMAGDMGVLNVTGRRQIVTSSAVPAGAPAPPAAGPMSVMPQPPPALAPPAVAPAGASPGMAAASTNQSVDLSPLQSSLQQIAANTGKGQTTNVALVLDSGEVLAKLQARAGGGDARSFTQPSLPG